MYISTNFYIGDTVFFYDGASDCVTRAKVKEIRTTQYKHATHTNYLLEVLTDDGISELTRSDTDLFRDSAAAFRANPLPVAEPEAVEA